MKLIVLAFLVVVAAEFVAAQNRVRPCAICDGGSYTAVTSDEDCYCSKGYQYRSNIVYSGGQYISAAVLLEIF